MDIEEAVLRLRANAWIMVIAAIAGVLAPVAHAFVFAPEDRFEATARVVLESGTAGRTEDPQVVEDTARGIVTSIEMVARNLDAVGARREVESFARQSVRIDAVGRSPVLDLTVIDTQPSVAVSMANALATDLVRDRKERSDGELLALVEDLRTQIRAEGQRIRSIGAQLDRSTGPTASLQQRYQDALASRDRLEAERRDVLNELASRPVPEVIDRAAAATAIPAASIADHVLGLIVGLILGLAVVASKEVIKPTVAGPRGFSRLLGAPSAGHLSEPPDVVSAAQLAIVSARIRLAAESARVSTATLIEPTNGFSDLAKVALRLHGVSGFNGRGGHDGTVRFLAFEGDGIATVRAAGSSVGLVVVTPRTVPARALEEMVAMGRMTGWPTLCFVTYDLTRQQRKDGEKRAQEQVGPVVDLAGDERAVLPDRR